LTFVMHSKNHGCDTRSGFLHQVCHAPYTVQYDRQLAQHSCGRVLTTLVNLENLENSGNFLILENSGNFKFT